MWKFVREEEILEIMGLTFLAMIACTSAAVLMAPLQFSEPARTLFYARQDPVFTALFILVPPVVISIVAGLATAIASAIQLRRIKRQWLL